MDFHAVSEEALTKLQRALERAADKYGFDVDRNEGALTIEFEDPPARFVVSPNSPVKQIWISARVQSFKLDWNPDLSAFTLHDGRKLDTLLADLISQQLDEPIAL